MMKSFKVHLNEAVDRPPRWKKDTSMGEGGAQTIEFPKTKGKYRVSKFLDPSTERHKGEWNLEVWDPRRREFVWSETLAPKAWVKELCIYRGQFKHDARGDFDKKQQVTDYSKTFKFDGHY
jgi:hypothetical protein